MFNTYNLIPNDGRKSFYGKAQVYVLSNGNEILKSYDTFVAIRYKSGNVARLWDGWSATTGRHIRAFCGMNKAEFTALPLKSVDVYEMLWKDADKRRGKSA